MVGGVTRWLRLLCFVVWWLSSFGLASSNEIGPCLEPLRLGRLGLECRKKGRGPAGGLRARDGRAEPGSWPTLSLSGTSVAAAPGNKCAQLPRWLLISDGRHSPSRQPGRRGASGGKSRWFI